MVISRFPAAASVLIASLLLSLHLYFFNGLTLCFVKLRNLAASVSRGVRQVLAVRVVISFCCHAKRCVISGNNKQRGASEMSGSRKCVEQNKQRKIDTATCIPQANELLLLVSVFTFTIVITLLKRARIPADTHTMMLPPFLSSYRDNRKSQSLIRVEQCFYTSIHIA